ncbi:MAG: DUF3592 domain-containing protein [Amphiplicatus sp.]
MNGAPVLLTLFFGLFLAVGLAILGFGLRSLSLSKQAEGWPTAQGRIVSSDFVTDTDDDGTTYRTKLRYAYNVAGRDYEGDKIAFGYSASSGRAFHREIYEALPAGSQVAVRYDESDPARAVLAFGVNQSILFLLIFGGVWTLFTLGMAAMFWLGEKGAGGLLQNIIIYARG